MQHATRTLDLRPIEPAGELAPPAAWMSGPLRAAARVLEAENAEYTMPRNDYRGARMLHLNENLFEVPSRLGAAPRPIDPADLIRYPEGGDRALRRAIADQVCVPETAVFVNCGASALINQLFAVFANCGATALLPEPTWSYYHTVLQNLQIRRAAFPLRCLPDRFAYDRRAMIDAVRREAPDLVVITSPNNPTGNSIRYADVVEVARRAGRALVMVDEAYFGFTRPDPLTVGRVLTLAPNVVFVRTLSKAYGLAGLRVGFAIAGPLGQRLLSRLPVPFGIPAFAQEIAIDRLTDAAFLAGVRRAHAEALAALRDGLAAAEGFTVLDTDANFALVRTPPGRARAVRDHLEAHGYIVKVLSGGPCRDHLRITLATPAVMDEVARLITAV